MVTPPLPQGACARAYNLAGEGSFANIQFKPLLLLSSLALISVGGPYLGATNLPTHISNKRILTEIWRVSTFTKMQTWALLQQHKLQFNVAVATYVNVAILFRNCCLQAFLFLLCFIWLVYFLLPPTPDQPSNLVDLAELGQWLEKMILKVFPTEVSLGSHDLRSTRSTTASVHSLNLSLQEQQQMQSQALPLPVCRSDVEPTQLAWKGWLRAVVCVQPSWLVMLHVQHLLAVHGAAPSSMGHGPPALGRATVLEEEESRKHEIYSVWCTCRGCVGTCSLP